MVFFNPAASFLAWLKTHAANRIVFDVGCGNGELLRRMWKTDIKAVGINVLGDIQIEDPQTLMRTLCQDAVSCRMLHEARDGLVLFCRPDHSGWVSNAIVKLHESVEVLYISLPVNVPVDLPNFETERVKVPGCRPEEVHRVLRPFPTKVPFYVTADQREEILWGITETKLARSPAKSARSAGPRTKPSSGRKSGRSN